jgi:hypothetical protein
VNDVLTALSTAVFSVFLIVILSGLVSGLVALGYIELFARSAIQRRVVRSIAERGWSFRFGKMVPPHSPELASNLEDGLPFALGMDPPQFFNLHHRQICGLLIAGLSRESMAKREPSSSQHRILPEVLALAPPSLMSGAGFIPGDYERRPRASDVDLATSVVDNLQVELSRHLFLAAFWSAFAVWLLLFALAATPAIFTFKSFFRTLFESAAYVGAILPACLLFAFAAAVVGALVFGWLDRVFSIR